MSEKLKPCPFCGEKEDIDYGIYNGTLKGFDYVQCQTCGATINDVHKGKYIAAEKLWNTRADERPKGKWEICSDGYYPYCSNCNNEPESGKMTNFCPNYGADMRKENTNA